MSETFEILDAVEPIYDEWDELASRSASDPFARPGWITAWHRSFSSGRLEVHVLRRGGKLVALAPFVRRRRLLDSPTNWHTPYFEIVADDAESAAGLIERSFTHMPARLRIRFTAAAGITDEAVAAAGATAGLTISRRVMARSPVIRLDGDFESYRRSLSKNLRKNLNRRRSRLEELGQVETAVDRDGTHLDAGLDDAMAIEASGWKGQKQTAIASQARTRRFYSEMTRWAAETGILRLVFLRLDGKPIAFDLGLQSHGTYYSLKTGYDASRQRLGPGAALTHDLIRYCYDKGLDRLALLGVEDDFKRQWAGESAVDLIELQAFKGPLMPFDRLVQVRGRALARHWLERGRSFLDR